MKKYIKIFGFAALLSAQSAFAAPENGWWWNPAESGRGFNIETQDRTVFIATFVYEKAGNPIWYSGTGKLNASDTVTATLMRSDGGQCISCAHTEPTSSDGAGPITIKFTSQSTGIVTWSGGTTNIERFNFALGNKTEQLLGEWALMLEDSSSPIYEGELLALTIINSDGTAEGTRTGDAAGHFRVIHFDAPTP
jgi:hypothetical protein